MQPSPNARSPTLWACLAAYLFLIVYASLYPFVVWSDLGLPPFAYFGNGLPRYWTWFDVITNVLGYIPFGFILVLIPYPQWHGLGAILLATLGGALLSGGLEATQTFLPSRVPSLLDWLTNLGGTLIGAVLGSLLATPILLRSKLAQLRRQWLVHEAGPGLVLLALWPLAQVYPQG